MGFNRKSIATLGLLLISTSWAQEAPRFQATANAADSVTPIGGKGVFGVGFYTETIYPMNRAFSSDTAAGNQDMRFQIPLGFGLEASYGITRQMEIALSGGFDYFKTQNFRTLGVGNTKIYDEAKYRLYPIMGLFRYRWPRKNWAPEAELGLGAALGDITVTAYKSPRESQKQSGPFYRGHLAVGTGFSWGEGASLHFQLGYAVNQLGAKTYTFADGNTTKQSGLMQGIFSKASLKFYF
jgi:hypothetical protein